MKRDLRKPTDSERAESPRVLQPAEFSFHGGAARVEVTEAARLARDQRETALGLDPNRLRVALASRAAPLGGVALEVGTGERPAAVRGSFGALRVGP